MKKPGQEFQHSRPRLYLFPFSENADDARFYAEVLAILVSTDSSRYSSTSTMTAPKNK